LLLPYCSLWCHAAGNSSSSSFGYTGARSVTTSAGGAPAVVSARSKNARAAAVSRLAATYTSMTCPYSSTARCTYRQEPPIFT
jgi:hypothetical protein